MPNPWLNEHKSTAAMNYFLIDISCNISCTFLYMSENLISIKLKVQRHWSVKRAWHPKV